MAYTIENPYETAYINFLQLWLITTLDNFSSTNSQSNFDLTQKNRLVPLFELIGLETGKTHRGFIGQYGGRRAGTYQIEMPETDTQASGVYVFVLKGAFEVQDRLLHERDGLALLRLQNNVVEFEALSPDAILIILNVSVEN